MPRICFRLLVTLAVFAVGGQRVDAQVAIELRLLKPDSRGGDQNVRDEKVWLLPSSGVPAVQTTGPDGVARFQIAPTAYVKLRIGNPPNQIQLYQMSGRFSQSTSAYMNALYGASDERVISELEQFIDELSNAFQDRDVLESIRNELTGIKEELLRATVPRPNAGAENERRAEVRARSGRQIDSLLNRRNWRIGVFCNYTDEGAVITSVEGNSPASRAGIRVGQCITSVDGQKVGVVGGRIVTLSAETHELLHAAERGVAVRFVELAAAGSQSVVIPVPSELLPSATQTTCGG